MAKPKCQHCHAEAVTRPRGLGWVCYYAPGVRALYPSTSKYARRGTKNFYRAAPLPVPTAALPGTPEKIEVMLSRSVRGEALFHPDDAIRLPADTKGRAA